MRITRNTIRCLGQAVKTLPFHGSNMGSNPVGITIILRGVVTVAYQPHTLKIGVQFSSPQPKMKGYSRRLRGQIANLLDRYAVRGFEPHPFRQFAGVAQLAAQLICNQ